MAVTTTFKGISFPFKAGTTSFPEAVTDSDLIRQSIIRILMTERGERIMRPDYGSGMMARVFDNNDSFTATLIQSEVYSAVGRYEPRAVVQGVDIERQDSTMTITISYIVIATKEQSTVTLALAIP
jgi:phage baseplate assembly protein W